MTTLEQAPDPTPATHEQPLWVTLREASDAVGVSVSALRKAYRAGRLEARDEEGPYGQQKRVRLDEVRDVMGAASSSTAGAGRSDGRTLVLLEEARRGWDAVAALHQAAAELAETRERAGRAEGEARVYAELVDELRARVALLEHDLAQSRAGTRPTTSSPARLTSSSPAPGDDDVDRPGWFRRRRP